MRKRGLLHGSLGVILLTFAVYAVARSEPVDPLTMESPKMGGEAILFNEVPSVFGASRFDQKVTEAPSSITIITGDEIKKYGYRTLAEALQSVKGFFFTYDRNYSYIGARGFGKRPGDYNTRVLLLVDGHRINDNIYDQAFIGTDFPVDIDLIDRIEVIPGPSSSLYGTNAFLGVINVLTRRGRDLKGMELSADAGSFDTYKGRATYGNRFDNGVELLLSGSLYKSWGQDIFFKEFDHPSTNNGIARDCDDDKFYSLFSRLRWQDFTVEGVYHSREKGIPTAPFETVFNDNNTRTTDERGYLDLKYEHKFANDLGLMARAYYDHYGYDGRYMYDYADPGDPKNLVLEKDFAKGDWVGTEFQLSKKLFEKHRLILGAEYRNNIRQDQGAYDTDPFFLHFQAENQTYSWAVYLQDEFRILDNLILNAGVRHDQYSTFGGTTNPRAALIYMPFQKTALKLLYGTAFRAPNAYELYYGDNLTQKSNTALKPEKIETYELVWEQYLWNHLRLSTSGFYYKIKDLIAQRIDPLDDLIVYGNENNVEAKGIEIELDGKWSRGIETKLSYTWQETKDGETGSTLTNSPRHMAKFNLIAPIYKDLIFGGVELRYLSSRKTLAGNDSGDVFITNLTLFSRNLFKGLEISTSLYNLFDRKYGDPGSQEHLQDIIMQDGRAFRVKLTYSF